MLGKRYVIDHCVSVYSKSQKELTYRIYVTNMLYRLDRVYRKDDILSFYEIINGKVKKEDTRSADEIKNDLMTRINRLSAGG